MLNQQQIKENTTLQRKIAALEQAGLEVGALETRLSPFHKGQITLRDQHWFCSQHVTLDQGSGTNGAPVTGESHYDLFNPWKLPILTTLMHTEYDLIPDKMGERFPWFPTPANICSW
ncbi:MAG: hypothetical protein WB622_14165 [Acidobacteriaceae bacterium]